MLTEAEQTQLARDLLDLIEQRITLRLPDVPGETEALTAALEVDAALKKVLPQVSKLLDARARRAGMTLAAIGAARGIRKQSVHRRVSGG
jgi:hypothetical protein